MPKIAKICHLGAAIVGKPSQWAPGAWRAVVHANTAGVIIRERDSIENGRGHVIARYRVGEAWIYALWYSGVSGRYERGRQHHLVGTYDSADAAKARATDAPRGPD